VLQLQELAQLFVLQLVLAALLEFALNVLVDIILKPTVVKLVQTIAAHAQAQLFVQLATLTMH
jgi:hypothetical protein